MTGGGTDLSTSRTGSTAARSTVSARAENISRCSTTSRKTVFTSSGMTKSRPSTKAAALAMAATARVARGLAPWASMGWLRVAFTSLTMYSATSPLTWTASTWARISTSPAGVSTVRTRSRGLPACLRRSSSSSSSGLG